MADDWLGKNWLMILIFIIIVGVMALVAFPFIPLLKGNETTLSVLLILGVIALIMALTVAAVVFHYLNLADPKQSLGLPEGSVRAVIALSLILIFMISSLFLYEQVDSNSAPHIMVSQGLTQQQADAIPQADIAYINKTGGTGNTTLYDVGRIVPNTDKTSEDIAKQVITTVSTLVVAVSSFYFGAKTASPATKTPAKSSPVISKVDPASGARGAEISLTITGKNFDSNPDVKLVLGSAEIHCTDVTASPTKINCKLKVPTDATAYPAGKWAVVVTNSDKGQDTHQDAFTVS